MFNEELSSQEVIQAQARQILAEFEQHNSEYNEAQADKKDIKTHISEQPESVEEERQPFNNQSTEIRNLILNVASKTPSDVHRSIDTNKAYIKVNDSQHLKNQGNDHSKGSLRPKHQKQKGTRKNSNSKSRSPDSTNKKAKNPRQRQHAREGYQSTKEARDLQRLSFQNSPDGKLNPQAVAGPMLYRPPSASQYPRNAQGKADHSCPVHGLVVFKEQSSQNSDGFTQLLPRVLDSKNSSNPINSETINQDDSKKIVQQKSVQNRHSTVTETVNAEMTGVIQDSMSYTSATESAFVPINLEILTQKEKELLAEYCQTELSHIAQGNFKLGPNQLPILIASTSQFMPYSQKAQNSLENGPTSIKDTSSQSKGNTYTQDFIVHDSLTMQNPNLSQVDLKSVQELSEETPRRPITIAMSDVPTVDRGSCVQRSCELYSNQNLSTVGKHQEARSRRGLSPQSSSGGHTSMTSYEDFYNYGNELDTRINSPPHKCPVHYPQGGVTIEVDEELEEESDYDSEAEHHLDTQHDELESNCRFLKNGLASKSSRRSGKGGKRNKPSALMTSKSGASYSHIDEQSAAHGVVMSPSMQFGQPRSNFMSNSALSPEDPNDMAEGASTNLAFNNQKLYEECQCPKDEKDSLFGLKQPDNLADQTDVLSFKFQTKGGNAKYVTPMIVEENNPTEAQRKTVAFSQADEDVNSPDKIVETSNQKGTQEQNQTAGRKDEKHLVQLYHNSSNQINNNNSASKIDQDNKVKARPQSSQMNAAPTTPQIIKKRDILSARPAANNPPKSILITSKSRDQNKSKCQQRGLSPNEEDQTDGAGAFKVQGFYNQERDSVTKVTENKEMSTHIQERQVKNIRVNTERPQTAVVKSKRASVVGETLQSDQKDQNAGQKRHTSQAANYNKLDQIGAQTISSQGQDNQKAQKPRQRGESQDIPRFLDGSGGILLSEDDIYRDQYPPVITSPSIFIPNHRNTDGGQEINVTNLLIQTRSQSKEGVLVKSHVSQKDQKGTTFREQIEEKEEIQLNSDDINLQPHVLLSEPKSSPQHESNADQKSRVTSQRNVKFTDQSIQITSGLLKTDVMGSKESGVLSHDQQKGNKTPKAQGESVGELVEPLVMNSIEKEQLEDEDEDLMIKSCNDTHGGILSNDGQNVVDLRPKMVQYQSNRTGKDQTPYIEDSPVVRRIEERGNQGKLEYEPSVLAQSVTPAAQQDTKELSQRIQKYWELYDKKTDENDSVERDQSRQLVNLQTNQFTPMQGRLNSGNDSAEQSKIASQTNLANTTDGSTLTGTLNRTHNSSYVMNRRRLRSSNTNDRQQNNTQIRNTSYANNGCVGSLTAVKRRNIKSGQELMAEATFRVPEVLPTRDKFLAFSHSHPEGESQDHAQRIVSGKLTQKHQPQIPPIYQRHQTPDYLAQVASTTTYARTMQTAQKPKKNYDLTPKVNYGAYDSGIGVRINSLAHLDQKSTFAMQYSKLKTKQEDRRNTAQTEEMYGAQNANNSILMYHRVQNMGVDFDTASSGKQRPSNYDRRSQNRTTVTSAPSKRQRSNYRQRQANTSAGVQMPAANSSRGVPIKTRDPYTISSQLFV